MLPWLPFAAGMVTGAVAIKLLRTDSTRVGLDKAQEKLRNATVSSLAAIESSSAAMRERIAAAPLSAVPSATPGKAAGRVRKTPATKAARPAKRTKVTREAKPRVEPES